MWGIWTYWMVCVWKHAAFVHVDNAGRSRVCSADLLISTQAPLSINSNTKASNQSGIFLNYLVSVSEPDILLQFISQFLLWNYRYIEIVLHTNLTSAALVLCFL